MKSKAVQKKEYMLCEEMKLMAAEILNEKKIDIQPAKVEYIAVYPNLSKSVVAKCVKTSKELKFFSNLDYVIEISGEIWDVLDQDTRKILLEHELRKILVLNDEKTGDWKFKLKPYDMKGFSRMIDDYGNGWIQKIKLSLSSVYDLTPAEEDRIQF